MTIPVTPHRLTQKRLTLQAPISMKHFRSILFASIHTLVNKAADDLSRYRFHVHFCKPFKGYGMMYFEDLTMVYSKTSSPDQSKKVYLILRKCRSYLKNHVHQGFSLASAIGHSPKIVPDVREFAV